MRYTLFATLGSLYPAYADYIEQTFGGLRVLGGRKSLLLSSLI